MSSVTFWAKDWMNNSYWMEEEADYVHCFIVAKIPREVDLILSVVHNIENLVPLTKLMFGILCFPNAYILIVKPI